ncbi:integral membrane protein [Gulosibacter sp. 10]|nr:integral membrane protein [Gulosibacter sp. 10]
MLVRPRRGSAVVVRLQLIAAGVTTLLTFAVAALVAVFWRVPADEIGYRVLALALAGLLLVPLITLGTAAARLAVRSREDRLATLRLLGATAGRVRRIAVAEVALIAAIGVALGTLLAIPLPWALSLLSVYGRPLAPEDLLLPWWLVVAIPPALIGIATASGALGLRRVVVSPLGVRMRQQQPRMSVLRVVAALLVVGAAVLVMQTVSPGWGVVVIIGAIAAAVVAVMAVLGVVGPFLVTLVARRRAARTQDAATLIAMRGVLDDPRSAWRGVSALALASFVLVPAGSMLGYLEMIRGSKSREIMTRDQLLLFADARTMLIAMAAVSFLVVACQVAITQTASIVERRDLYTALDRLGMPLDQLDRARRIRVAMPARVAVIGAVGIAVAVAFWLVIIAAVTAPLFLVGVGVLLLAGLLLIRLGVGSTRPVLRQVLAAPARGE